MKYLYSLAAILLLGALGLLVAGQAGLFAGTPPQNLGVSAGRLLPPSTTPNSVSSQAGLYPDHPQRDYAAIAPLRYRGDGEAAMQKLAGVLASSPGTRIITQRADYIYAQSRTTWLGFTDDLEFWLDREAGVIQLRSASRLGRKDFGKNRARIEAIRARF
ncbi:DUF1499 domain-containing protein [Pseudomonas sp. N040]|uniref:DUF1499 domain-containing protein n=1 Tax=Pseudomonas sp. N040 TaxID=2785325 RepID=UPI0018A29B32|nr:DUF1499 domain-containing protein [Pseudomonas sp. N040]MBF7729046.1 DUF1499 domain-containing protein [Pseudomonas sp. N040]MBW7012686.1 DUF1499 domain-containing protein [Pseudomonas sp. N040]